MFLPYLVKSRSNGQGQGYGGIPCRPNQAAALLVFIVFTLMHRSNVLASFAGLWDVKCHTCDNDLKTMTSLNYTPAADCDDATTGTPRDLFNASSAQIMTSAIDVIKWWRQLLTSSTSTWRQYGTWLECPAICWRSSSGRRGRWELRRVAIWLLLLSTTASFSSFRSAHNTSIVEDGSKI